MLKVRQPPNSWTARQVDSGHDQPGGEGVPIRVPSIPREPVRIPARLAKRLAGPLNGGRKEAVRTSRVLEDPTSTPRGPRGAEGSNVHEGRTHQGIHRELAAVAVLRTPHREGAGQKVCDPPLKRKLLAPAQPGVNGDREQGRRFGWSTSLTAASSSGESQRTRPPASFNLLTALTGFRSARCEVSTDRPAGRLC